MKRIITSFVVVCSLLLISCSDNSLQKDDIDYQVIAWNYLIKNNMTVGITQSFEQAAVEHSTWDGRESVMVVFHTTADALQGPIVVHIDPVTNKVFGIQPRL